MDRRLREVLELLAQNVNVLDGEVLRMARSEQLIPTEECLPLIGRIRDSCLSTLQNLQSLERSFQSRAFVIPEEMLARLE